MRSKIGAGILAGILAALPYGSILSIATSPMGMGGQESMTSSGSMAMEEPAASSGSMAMAEPEPMLMMVAHMVRSDSLAVAWILLLLGGAVMGALFGILFGSRPARSGGWLARGVVYGGIWWIAAGLVLMPILLGMPAFSPLTDATMRGGAMVGLAAYLLSGAILGFVFALVRGRNAVPG